MNPEKRLALLFTIWHERSTNPGIPEGQTAEAYGEACAAYLIELDATTDGEKLLPKTGGSI